MPPAKTAAVPDTSTRSRITAAAVDLWSERGYHGASLRDIARVVGVQMSTLYHYHPSKQSLLVELMSATMDELTEQVTAAVYSARSTREKLLAGVRAHVMYHAERSKEIFITDSELRSLEPLGRELIVGKRDAYSQMFAVLYKQGVADGDFAIKDVPVAMSAMFGMINSVPLWYRPEGRLTLSAIADYIGELVINGIGAPQAKQSR
ncbi:TetR/AcrR family transcriptional regulator [Mycolicibacterium baixiangningiae]|uniref:TetR/AcrR family transcriptional regulator n=1 Tax=Mycolicibacterium baixiangningiae TaxID=2761578 RepID=UPI0018667C85|nr:TetR/AcrR family transcriptional regulator [Mycolicibacterium baixiangningiae]